MQQNISTISKICSAEKFSAFSLIRITMFKAAQLRIEGPANMKGNWQYTE